MRHTAGFNYTGPHDENGELSYARRGLTMTNPSLAMDEFVTILSETPLLREPGIAWDYSWATDLLGRIVEILSGHTLAEFFSDRIFQPLGMHDTGFEVPEEKWGRIAPLYQPGQDGTVTLMPGPLQSAGRKPPRGFFGGGGLLGTAFDYVRLTQMLLNGGELDGVRLLSRMTVDLMRSDLLGNLPSANSLLAPGHGFGITVAINKGPAHSATLPAPGQYRWGGMAGTAWWVDPREEMTGVFMMQTVLDLSKRNEFMQLAYQAIID
jgi:CubicO group peptidase (beta-lactamase class C family)